MVSGRGRAADLTATAMTRADIEPGRAYVRLMYAQDRGDAPWDGTWHLAGFAVPESAREARTGLRQTITALGGAPIHGGLYVSPHAWESDIEQAAAPLDAGGYLVMATTTQPIRRWSAHSCPG